MTEEQSAYDALRSRLRDAESWSDLEALLRRLAEPPEEEVLAPEQVTDLRTRAFLSLQQQTLDDPDAAEVLIQTYLIPLCLRAADDDRVPQARFRERLGDWVAQYPEVQRVQLRERLLRHLVAALHGPTPGSAAWTIAAIGFRRRDLPELLLSAGLLNDSEEGDRVLASLSALVPPAEIKERMLQALHSRAAIRPNQAILSALWGLADRRSLQIIVDRFLFPEPASGGDSLPSLALRALTAIADENHRDHDLQLQVWGYVLRAFKERPENFEFDLFSGGDVAPRCNSRRVVPDLLSVLASKTGNSERERNQRYLIGNRLVACTRPEQLQGWRLPTPPTLLELLRSDACMDTRAEGRWATQELHVKEQAWETAQRHGRSALLGWIESAVGNETNPYARGRVLERLAAFKYEELPSIVTRLVTEPHDAPRNDPTGEVFPRLAAVQVARSSATPAAFEALLRFGLTYQGEVLRDITSALSEVTDWLLIGGDRRPLIRLVATATKPTADRSRRAAAAALGQLAAHVQLAPAEIADIEAAALSGPGDGRDDVERNALVEALASIADYSPVATTRETLHRWSEVEEGSLPWSALKVLVRAEGLSALGPVLHSRLGLQLGDRGWDVVPDAELGEWAPSIIAHLYRLRASEFAGAVATVIRDREWAAAVQVLGAVAEMHQLRADAPPIVANALRDRIDRRSTQTYAEPELFNILARTSPLTLLQAAEDWEAGWRTWLPEARAALAEAIGVASQRVGSARTAHLLLTLATDGQYAVRRVAFRTLAGLSPISLHQACEQWAQVGLPEVRQRAAEGASWLAGSRRSAGNRLIRRLRHDPEPAVRDTASRERLAARDRQWTGTYLKRLQRTRRWNNRSVLRLYAYGGAIAATGDDGALRVLAEMQLADQLPPHARAWLRQVSRALEKRWQAARREWPGPTLAWPGALEEQDGVLETPGRRRYPVRLRLWLQPARSVSEVGDWGADAIGPGLHLLGLVGDDEIVVELKDGRRGRALPATSTDRGISLVGLGAFPV